LSRDTTVRQWLRAGVGFWLQSIINQLTGEYWSDVAESLNQQFGIDVSDRDWFAVIKPWQATLGQLCDFIAARALVEVVPEVNLSAKLCRKAGLFLALRARLQAMHGMGAELHPSSPLPDRPVQAFKVREAWAMIAPECGVKLEPVEQPGLVKQWLRWLWTIIPVLFGLMLLAILMGFWWPAPQVAMTVCCLFGCIVVCVGVTAYITVQYDRWHWPRLRTYRDLVRGVW